MRTIELTRKNQNVQETLYVSIANRWIRVYEERALREDGQWEEYPLSYIEDKKDENLCIRLRKMTDQDAVKLLVKLKAFTPVVLQKLKSFKLGY